MIENVQSGKNRVGFDYLKTLFEENYFTVQAYLVQYLYTLLPVAPLVSKGHVFMLQCNAINHKSYCFLVQLRL